MCTARPVYHRPISLTRVKAKVDWKVRSMNSTVAPFSGLTLPSRPHAWTPPFCLGFFRRKTHNHISSRSAPFSSSSSTFSSFCELISFLPPLPPTSKNERMPFVYATGKNVKLNHITSFFGKRSRPRISHRARWKFRITLSFSQSSHA